MSDIRARINSCVRADVRALQAYHVPPAVECIKLDAMENPYGWPEELREPWLNCLRDAQLNRYPDPAAQALKKHLRVAMDVPAAAELLLGNGSDELIQMILMAVACPDRAVMSPDPGFVMYRLLTAFTGMNYVPVPLRAHDFSLDLPATLAAIQREQPAVVFLAYPNNPTGNLFAQEDVLAVIRDAPGLVVLDEAYAAFADATFMQRVIEFENLLVMRTVSKMGLAGLRLGLLVGHPLWIEEFDKVRLPYNINILTQITAEFAMQHRQMLIDQTRLIVNAREQMQTELESLPGVTAFPSRANFILFKVPAGRADEIFEGLRARGVLIKNLSGAGGLLQDCLRVTIGAPAENQAFLAALVEALRP